MHLLFVDESGTPPLPNKTNYSPFFVLGGVIIPEEIWHQVRDDFEGIKTSFDVQGEIKWRNFAPPNPESKEIHALSHLPAEQKEALRQNLFSIFSNYEAIKIIGVVADTFNVYKKNYVNTQNDLYSGCYKRITDRFQFYLQDVSKKNDPKINGIIVCDHRTPSDDKYLQQFHLQLLAGKADFSSNYRNLIEHLFITPSHYGVGIQLADLVGGAILRKFKNDDDRFFKCIESSIRKSSDGKMEGYGIVFWGK